MSYYNNFQRSKNHFNQIHRLPPCSKLTQFTIISKQRYYFHHAHNSIRIWSSANRELIQAITKVIILVILKIFIKYYVRSYLQLPYYIHQNHKSINELIDLLSKALTISIAKILIKRAIYPALRTAMKTLLIAGIKTLIKPWMKKIKNQNKSNEVESSSSSSTVLNKIIRFSLTIQIKTIIKTIALHLLWLMFEKNNNNNQINDLPGLMFRVAVIILVKTVAKRICKMAKKKKDKIDSNNQQTITQQQPPVDQILLFATQKLVTKLIKIPLIKLMF